MAKKTAERVFVLFLLAVLLFVMSMGGFTVSYAYADTGGELNYDSTNVLDDLKSATVNGQPFDLTAYPRNPFGSPQVITFCGILLFAVRERQRELCAVYLCV